MRFRLLLLLVIGSLAVAAPASASVIVRSLDTTRWPNVRVTVTVDTPPGTIPDLSVIENGAPVQPLAVTSSEGHTAVALAIDTSGSMHGTPLKQALAGAQSFLDQLHPGDQGTVISFAHAVLTAQPLTSDVAALKTAVAGLSNDTIAGTALNDAVISAVTELTSAPADARRVLIVLTDGSCDKTGATAQDAIALALKDQVTIYTIGLKSGSFSPDALQQLATPTGGSFRAADLTAIDAMYGEIATEIAHTYVIGYKSTAAGHISVTVGAGSDSAQTGYVGGSAAVLRTSRGVVPEWITRAWWSTIAISVFVFGLALAGVMAVVRPRPVKTVDRQLSSYTEFSRRKAEEAEVPRTSLLVSLSASTDRIMRNVKFWRRIDGLIERADLPIKTGELFYIQVGLACLLGMPAGFAGVFPVLTFALFALGFVLPLVFVRFKARKRQKAFDNQLPDTLTAMAASLKAGHSWNQAVETIIKDGGEPAANEFGRVASEVRLGRTSDDAMEAMGKRLGSPDFEFVVMSVNIQRQVGGSMAELLDQISETVRQRQQFRRKVKALCAMGRMSAYTLVALPFLMGLGITAINSGYMAPLFTTSAGHILLIIAIVSISIGSLILKKIVSFKV